MAKTTKTARRIPEPDLHPAADEAMLTLATLRDVLTHPSDEDAHQLAAWEKMIKTHSLRRQWLSAPITQHVFEELKGRVAAINTRLSTEEEMPELARRAIFREKQAYMWMLTLFTDAKDDTVLQSLSREIAQATERFSSY